MLDTEQDLFEHELRDVYDAEKKLVRALESMASKVTDGTLSSSISEHRTTTQQQVKRLEQVFKLLDKKSPS
jgi:ferritin-like metal-binding protein YciE